VSQSGRRRRLAAATSTSVSQSHSRVGLPNRSIAERYPHHQKDQVRVALDVEGERWLGPQRLDPPKLGELDGSQVTEQGTATPANCRMFVNTISRSRTAAAW